MLGLLNRIRTPRILSLELKPALLVPAQRNTPWDNLVNH